MRSWMRRPRSAVLGGILSLAMLAGCGPFGSSSSPTPTPTPQTEHVVVTNTPSKKPLKHTVVVVVTNTPKAKHKKTTVKPKRKKKPTPKPKHKKKPSHKKKPTPKPKRRKTATPKPHHRKTATPRPHRKTPTPRPHHKTPTPKPTLRPHHPTATPKPTVSPLLKCRIVPVTTPRPPPPHTGAIAHTTTEIHRDQRCASKHRPAFLFLLHPRMLLKTMLPHYGFLQAPLHILIPKPAPAPTPTAFIGPSGSPRINALVSFQGHHYTIVILQPATHGPAGIWLIFHITRLLGRFP